MIWEFRIKKGNSSNETIIDEPVGWDAQKFTMRRDKGLHGIDFEYSSDFTFDGEAARIIREEYDSKGIEGNLTLIIKYRCEGGAFEELERYRFAFDEYQPEYGNTCEVTIPLEAINDVMTFRNRLSQKVNLETTQSFNGTALPGYLNLGISKQIPSKSIYVQNKANNSSNNSGQFQGSWLDLSGISWGMPYWAFFVPPFNNTIASEIGGFVSGTAPGNEEYELESTATMTGVELPYVPIVSMAGAAKVDLDQITPVVNYDKSLGKFHGQLLNLQLNITMHNVSILTNMVGGNPVTEGLTTWCYYCGIKRAKPTASNTTHLADGMDWISINPVDWAPFQGTVGQPPAAAGITDSRAMAAFIDLEEGDRLYFFYVIMYRKDDALQAHPAFNISYGANTTSFWLRGLSVAPSSYSKVFMVHEALSRITEAITDNKMNVYSEYFGRTDSQPQTYTQDGCGSLESITNGLLLRRIDEVRPAQPPLLTLSMQDLIAGLNPIHNIGMGIEAVSSTQNRVRIENWKWFYKDTVGFQCDDVNTIKLKVKAQDHYAIIKVGYDKWEAEEYNGIDEYNTRREYRTTLANTKSILEVVSRFIASPFAIEITRRLGNETSEDWRFDNETFILCMKRDTDGNIVVEQGAVNNAANIVDPATTLNYRISPARNAVRWLPMALASYRHTDNNSRILFTNGDGNFYAEGKLNSSFCNNESSVISEKGDLYPAILGAPGDARPIWRLEEVSFTYPCTVADWKELKNNRYKLVEFNCDNYSGSGWIEQIAYSPDKGTAEFTLRPKIES